MLKIVNHRDYGPTEVTPPDDLCRWDQEDIDDWDDHDGCPDPDNDENKAMGGRD